MIESFVTLLFGVEHVPKDWPTFLENPHSASRHMVYHVPVRELLSTELDKIAEELISISSASDWTQAKRAARYGDVFHIGDGLLLKNGKPFCIADTMTKDSWWMYIPASVITLLPSAKIITLKQWPETAIVAIGSPFEGVSA